MDLIIYQMMELQVVHVSDGDRRIEILTRSAIPQSHLAVSGDRHALPQLSVLSVLGQILHYLRQKLRFMLFLKLFPLQIDIIVCQIKSVHDIILFCTVKHWRSHVEAQSLRSQGQMDLQHLPDIHTGRHAQRIQHDIQRTTVGQIRHILHRQHAGNHTLVTVTACHLITHGNLSLLCNIDTDCLIYAGRQFITVLSGKHLGIHYNTILAVRHLQGSVTHFSCLLAEDRAQQSLLCGQLGLALGRHLTYQNIAGTHFRTDADDTSVIQILQCIITHAGHVPGDLLGSQLGVPGLCLVFFHVHGGVDILLHQSLTQKYRILVVITFPGHETDQRILTQSQLTAIGGRTIGNHLALLHMHTLLYDGLLVIAVGLVTAGEFHQMILIFLPVVTGHFDHIRRHIIDGAGLSGNHTDTGVHSRLRLHTGSHHGRLGKEKGHCLSLHVGTHQRTVRIIVLQERNQRRCH